MSEPSSIADVLDPGLATGPLAALLRPGRETLDVDLAPGRLVCPPAIRPYVLSLLVEQAAPLLVITQRSSDAEALADGLGAFLGEDRVAVFPAWETLPHERLSPQPATVGRRLAVLDRLCRPEAHAEPLLAVVAPVRAALQPMDPALGRRAPIELDGAWDGFDRLIERLAELGYARTPQVETRGEFAVRGGIVDVFPTAGDHAVRIEFWGDDVESMRTFTVADQRSTERVGRVVIDPARELVIDAELRERARDRAKAMPSLREHLELLADGITFEGVESLVTYLHPRPALLPDFLPDGAGVAVVDPLIVRQRAGKLREEAAVLLEVAWETLAGHTPEDVGFAEVDDVLHHAGERVWELDPLGSVERLPGMAWDSFRGDVEAVGARVRSLVGEGFRVVLTTAGHGPAKRLSDILGEQGTASSVHDEAVTDDYVGRAEIVASPLREGFLAPELGLAVLAEWDVFGPRRNRRASRRMGSRQSAAQTVLELAEGDAVVHRTHGVGVYRGMITREISSPAGGTAKRDYVKLECADGDMLFVPSDRSTRSPGTRAARSPR